MLYKKPLTKDLIVVRPNDRCFLQIRIRNRACGLNFATYLSTRGEYQVKFEPPFIPGKKCSCASPVQINQCHLHIMYCLSTSLSYCYSLSKKITLACCSQISCTNKDSATGCNSYRKLLNVICRKQHIAVVPE